MGIAALWMPILASAVLVFILSALVWTVLPWHKKDFKKTGNEEAVRSALSGSAPGAYMLPYCVDPADFKNPEMAQKYIDGPQGFITIVPNGLPQMGPKLGMSFAYNVFVGVICAYFVSRTVAPDASYLAVFRVAGATAFVAYGIAYIQDSIWFGRPWSLTAKSLFDALLYSLLTGGAFGWLA
jgi:hypothetical protein